MIAFASASRNAISTSLSPSGTQPHFLIKGMSFSTKGEIERRKRGSAAELGPNLDRLTLGVNLGDQWSQYCILGLEGETLSEGQVQTAQPDVAEFFQALTPARVVIEVGTHSAWVQEVIAAKGHQVLVANPRLMEGSKRRKHK